MEKLLTRDKFREAVFRRDNYKCVFCGLSAVDAHHILERRLWSDGGYYIDNGASVCSKHHLECESTVISVEEVREACGITRKVVPDQLYSDHRYDKWGNPVLDNGTRLRGVLYYDESFQKIVDKSVVFVEYVKYPRTFHLPWSDGVHDDDRVLDNIDCFLGKEIVVTEKLDGENTSLYKNYIHARSVDGRSHASRDWVKNFWSSFAFDIPDGWRICGENVYARHSIPYDDLDSFFYAFSIWSERNFCLSWDLTVEWFELLGICHVPVLYMGIFNEDKIRELYSSGDWSSKEGYVVRIRDGFYYGDFSRSVAKYVRRDHVITTKHWMHGQPIVPNKLKGC